MFFFTSSNIKKHLPYLLYSFKKVYAGACSNITLIFIQKMMALPILHISDAGVQVDVGYALENVVFNVGIDRSVEEAFR